MKRRRGCATASITQQKRDSALQVNVAALLNGALPGGALFHRFQPLLRRGHLLQTGTLIQCQKRETHLNIRDAETLARKPRMRDEMVFNHLHVRLQLFIKKGFLYAFTKHAANRPQ